MPRRKAVIPRETQIKTQLHPQTVWQALNEPVVEVSPKFAQTMIVVSIVFLMAAWVGPYWGIHNSNAANLYTNAANQGRVAGLQAWPTPEWYYGAAPGAVAGAFSEAADEVLDISEPVTEFSSFFAPGFQAVGDAWLQLMADPY